MLGIAVPGASHTFDPLLARTPVDRLVAGQIYEPLTRRVSGPYGETISEPGLVLQAEAGANDTIWRLRLRTGVRFHDGARLNASAVLQNAARWRNVTEGQALLPGLIAVDAPRPDLVRFIFDAPDREVVRELASARLGLVSPRALRSADAGSRLASGTAAGTGPFELHRRHEGHVLLARDPSWWGTRHELGPGLELIDVRLEPGADRRLALLQRGTVEVAEGLGPSQVSILRRDPLLTDNAGTAGTRVGLERSVREFASTAGVPVLSRVWLTTVAAGSG